MRHLKRLRALLAVLVLGVLVTACGGSSSTTHKSIHAPSPHPPGWGYPPPCPRGNSCVSVPPSAKLGTSKRMFDSVSLSEFPAHPFAALGYTSGAWPTFIPIRHRWPHTHAVSIAVTASHHADCLDIEPGDATPGQAPGWVRADKSAGWARPCLYSSYWEFVSQVRPALERAGIRRSQVFEIDANYEGCPRLDKTFDGTQCTDHALGRNLDESVVTERFLSIAEPAYRPHAKEIKALKVRRARNQIREKRQGCGHIPASRQRDRARCGIERQRVRQFTGQIKRLER